MKKIVNLLAAVMMIALFGCGGGGGDDSSDNTDNTGNPAINGQFYAGTVTFTGSGASESLPNFRIYIDGDKIGAVADCDGDCGEDWWNWGPAAYVQDHNVIFSNNIPEVEGGSTVALSLNLTIESETTLSGTAAIDWWIEEQNAYWHSEGPITAVKR